MDIRNQIRLILSRNNICIKLIIEKMKEQREENYKKKNAELLKKLNYLFNNGLKYMW